MASSRVYSHVLGTPEIGSLSRTGQIKIPAAEQGGGAVAHFQLQFGQVFEVGGVGNITHAHGVDEGCLRSIKK